MASRVLGQQDSVTPGLLFRASRRLVALSHFGVPYQVVESGSDALRGVERLWAVGGGASLLWSSEPAGEAPPLAAAFRLRTGAAIPIFGRIVTDEQARPVLAEQGGRWARATTLHRPDGEQVASIWRRDDGSVFLPFDPDDVRLNYLSERYREITRRPGGRDWRRIAARVYYRTRQLLPRAVQIWLRRRYAPVQARALFPRWPIETGLHDFLEFLLWLVQSIAEEPVPTIAPWPDGASWALVLTHDVETAAGLNAMDAVLDLERSLDLRSSWNFVPRRNYDVTTDRVTELVAEGFEVGVHGLYHDGRDLESASVLRDRLPGIRAAADKWNAVGFRAPATQRDWELTPSLGFDYDCSYPDTDPFEPQPGGCCTWLPFFNGEVVELPLTMPQDHTLFVILRQPDEQCWIDKADFLRDRGGMALIDTHPDYLMDEHILTAYRKLLERFAHDDTAWKALPRDVSDWWRRRAELRLERIGGEWRPTGPAATEARVELTWIEQDWPTHGDGIR